ncbi:MAG: gamma-glutamyl-gamma-aminobutyrate hydrolase family protein [Anaerolineae bacterium]|nr:gamma-glutamyl-gamma-aminobutyrate hydrolase family protein [Anaerolineae bacterium]
MKPRIGISTSSYIGTTGRVYNGVHTGNIQAIEAAGGLPVLIPVSVSEETLRLLYDQVDGLLLPGGSDINPQRYNSTPLPTTQPSDDPRDQAEITLARWATAEDRPVFGICRGHQLLNVALGGTLIQDIASDIKHHIMPRDFAAHDVRVDPNSHLAAVMQATQVQVNSLHHQGIEQVAPGLCITAYSPDGIIEAMELPDKRFALSVQWHPEDLYKHDPAAKNLFTAFVEAAREYAAR